MFVAIIEMNPIYCSGVGVADTANAAWISARADAFRNVQRELADTGAYATECTSVCVGGDDATIEDCKEEVNELYPNCGLGSFI